METVTTYIGIDNGVSGSIAILPSNGRTVFAPMPTKREQNYTKRKDNITRIDHEEFYSLISECNPTRTRVFVERPMVNPGRFKATRSALRALEAVLVVLEEVGLSVQYMDSRQWQSALLPKGCKGAELKRKSRDIGCRLFPHFRKLIQKHKDADSLLIAEYARRNAL